MGPMYEHGFATLFLAEVYGMSPRDDMRDKLARAVDLIVRTQNAEGGWRYQPRREDADISVTICQVMALRAARNAGLKVPNETVDRVCRLCEAESERGRRVSIHADAGRECVSAVGGGRGCAVQRGRVRRARGGARAGVSRSVFAARGRRWRRRCRMAISFTGITTPCRRCGRPTASGGRGGIRRFAICW